MFWIAIIFLYLNFEAVSKTILSQELTCLKAAGEGMTEVALKHYFDMTQVGSIHM